MSTSEKKVFSSKSGTTMQKNRFLSEAFVVITHLPIFLKNKIKFKHRLFLNELSKITFTKSQRAIWIIKQLSKSEVYENPLVSVNLSLIKILKYFEGGTLGRKIPDKGLRCKMEWRVKTGTNMWMCWIKHWPYKILVSPRKKILKY